MARLREYDVALLFSQDNDFAEAAEEIRAIAIEKRRWIKIASAYPYGPFWSPSRPGGACIIFLQEVIEMTATQIAARKNLYRRFRALPEEAAAKVLCYIDSLESHEPNEETLAAFRESENLDNLPSYETLEEMFEDFGIKIKC
jgi:hypothetical protein